MHLIRIVRPDAVQAMSPVLLKRGVSYRGKVLRSFAAARRAGLPTLPSIRATIRGVENELATRTCLFRVAKRRAKRRTTNRSSWSLFQPPAIRRSKKTP